MRKLNEKLKSSAGLLAAFPGFTGQMPTADDGFNYLAMIANKGMYWLATFAFLIAGIMIIVAGIKFMIAGGDEEKRKGATRTLIFSVVGVVVVILAQNFVEVIKNFFGA